MRLMTLGMISHFRGLDNGEEGGGLSLLFLLCDLLEDAYQARIRVERCVEDNDSCMIKNNLKLTAVTPIQVDETINQVPTVRKLCVLLYQALSYDDHISQSYESSQFHLSNYNIGDIRKYLDEGSTEALVHAFVSSKLDC